MKKQKIRIGGASYDALHSHLFPGDGLEAVAFALCGHLSTSSEEIYTVHSVFLYPHNKCTVREPDRVEWAPPEIVHLFEKCRKENLKLLKIHCHPEYWPFFSKVDDKSDLALSDTLTGWTDRNDNICSVIMLPDGSLMGRIVDAGGGFTPFTSILVISDNIQC